MSILKLLQNNGRESKGLKQVEKVIKQYEIQGQAEEEKDIDEFVHFMQQTQTTQQKIEESTKQGYNYYCKSCNKGFMTENEIQAHKQQEEHKINWNNQIKHKLNAFEKQEKRQYKQYLKQKRLGQTNDDNLRVQRIPRRKTQGRRVRIKQNSLLQQQQKVITQ